MGKKKPSYDTNRQVLGRIFPLDTPFNIILDVSEACNFKCNYCFRAEQNKECWGCAKDNQIMNWELFIKAVEQMKGFPQEVKQISLSNHGEPLVNRRLPDMVKLIKSEGIKSRVSIHTNASLLDEKYVYELADSRIDRIVVSLQGLDGKQYRITCGVKIDYEKFYGNLSLLYEKKKKNTQIHIKIANTALEESDKDKFFEMYEPIADRVFIEHIVPIWENINIDGVSDLLQNKYGTIFEKQLCCPLIFHTIVITPNGDVYPCTQLLRTDKLGNVKQQSLQELWECEYRHKLLMRQCKLDNPEICNNCYIRQNSIYAKEDMIDDYREEILQRLEKNSKEFVIARKGK